MTIEDRVEIWRLEHVLGGVDILRADFRRQRFAPHFHDDYTFGLVTRGANRFRYGRERVVAPAGTVCLAMPGEVHTGDAIDGGWSYSTVHVSASALAAITPNGRAPAFARAVIDDPDLARRFAAFFATAREAGDVFAHDVRLVESLGHLVERHADSKPRREPQVIAVAARVRDVLGDHACARLTLADLEAITGVGRFRIIRAFRAAYGMPPHAWQLQIRLARARAAIRSGRSIATAAADTGFADQSHLTRAFKRSFGFTPGLLRAG